MVKIASFNVENLFARPKALNPLDWSEGKPALEAYHKVSELLAKPSYSDAEKDEICQHFVTLDIYCKNDRDAIRRKRTQFPRWAWFRKNRGAFDRQPRDTTQNVQIIADGRGDWTGWVELAKAPVNDKGTRMTARVIKEVKADIIGIVEAEDRPSLMRFNEDLLENLYSQVMLVDGNDRRGIDVGIMTGNNFTIESIHSNVYAEDDTGIIFSRDCPQYEIRTPGGSVVHVLVNHFKSQSGGGGDKRQRQAAEVRRIVDGLVAQGQHVVVLGDFNEGPATAGSPPVNLTSLFDGNGPLIDCYTLQGFQVGDRPGTYDSCGLRNRLDYILISRSLQNSFTGGGVFRKGLWGSRKTRPDKWPTYQEMEESAEQASDHALVYINLNI